MILSSKIWCCFFFLWFHVSLTGSLVIIYTPSLVIFHSLSLLLQGITPVINSSRTRQDDKNYYIISDYYMGGDVQADHGCRCWSWDVVKNRVELLNRVCLGEWLSFRWWYDMTLCHLSWNVGRDKLNMHLRWWFNLFMRNLCCFKLYIYKSWMQSIHGKQHFTCRTNDPWKAYIYQERIHWVFTAPKSETYLLEDVFLKIFEGNL